MEWIKVEDKLPELNVSFSHGFRWESERVLVATEYGIDIACFYSDEGQTRFWWWLTRRGEELPVTHWMLLPKRPYATI